MKSRSAWAGDSTISPADRLVYSAFERLCGDERRDDTPRARPQQLRELLVASLVEYQNTRARAGDCLDGGGRVRREPSHVG